MKSNASINWLFPLIMTMAIFCACMGLFYQNSGTAYTFTSLRGQAVNIFGSGLYQYDNLFTVGAFRGADIVTLALVTPLSLLAYWRYRKNSLRGKLLLSGLLIFYLYNSFSLTFMAAFNFLFPVYIAFLSASFFAFIAINLELSSIQIHLSGLDKLPHKGMGIFLIAAGAGTLFIWGSELIEPLRSNTSPEHLAHYTTLVTHALDMGIIAPAAMLTGILLLQRQPIAYPFSFSILLLNTLIGAVVFSQTLVQINLGISFSPGQLIGMIGSWVILAGIALYLVITYLRRIKPVY